MTLTLRDRFRAPITRSRTARRRLILEAVPGSVQRLNHIKFGIGTPEFLAQAFDVAVHVAILDIDLLVVGRVHQGVTTLDPPRTGDERLQDAEFGERQGDGSVLPDAAMA